MVWYSHLLKNFPQFVVTHTVKGFDIVNKAEIDVFSGTLLLFVDPTDVGKHTNNIEKLLLNHAQTPEFLASRGEEFNRGPETRLDRSELCVIKFY